MEVFQTIINYVLNLGSACSPDYFDTWIVGRDEIKKSIHVCFDFRDCF